MNNNENRIPTISESNTPKKRRKKSLFKSQIRLLIVLGAVTVLLGIGVGMASWFFNRSDGIIDTYTENGRSYYSKNTADGIVVVDEQGNKLTATGSGYVNTVIPPVYPAYAGPVMNWVKVNTADNGVVKSGPLAASAGATVTLYPKAAEGFVLDTIEVLDAEGNAVVLDGLKFAIPAGGVTVNATFKAAQ